MQLLLRPLPVLLAVAAIAGASCRDRSPSGVAEMQGNSTGSIELWVTLRRDPRCEAGRDCGWLLRELNRHAEDTCVDAIDLGPAGFGPDIAREVLEAPDGAVVLSGERGRSGFVAHRAFRALPGFEASPADVFVQVAQPSSCDARVCEPRLLVLNTDIEVLAPSLALAGVEAPWLDKAWLEDRVLRRSAVLAGRLLGDPGDRGIQRLEVSEAFVPLPDRSGACPRVRTRACSPGTVPVLSRDVDRCVIQTGCARPRSCRELPLLCDPGYVLRAWPEQQGCRAHACDPAFLPE